MRADASEVQALAAHMADAGQRASVAAERVMDAAGLRARNRARELIRGQIRPRFLPHYAASITHEVVRTGSGVDAEFGPEANRPQGGMGPGVEYGSSNAPPLPHIHPTADEVAPELARELAALGAEEAL